MFLFVHRVTTTMATAQSALTFAVCILMITELILAKKDYYTILGVPKDATERQIKKAFHRLAMKYHPDRNKSPDAEAIFREAAEGEFSFHRLTFALFNVQLQITVNILCNKSVQQWLASFVHVFPLQ